MRVLVSSHQSVTGAGWKGNMLQHTATHCNALQHSHFNTLQHTAAHCNTLQHTATHCNNLTATHCNALQRTATTTSVSSSKTRGGRKGTHRIAWSCPLQCRQHCHQMNTSVQQETVFSCIGSRLNPRITHCNTLHCTCNTLQHNVIHSNTLQHISNTLLHTPTHCRLVAKPYNHSLQHLSTLHRTCNTLQHTPTYFQHAATYPNILSTRG